MTALIPLFGTNVSRYLIPYVPMMLVISLSACEPRFSIAWSKDFANPVSVSCIRDTLKLETANLTQGSYVSDGAHGFSKGVTVTQFGYSDPSGVGYFNLDVATDGSRTRFHHSFGKLGNRPGSYDIQGSTAVLTRNNKKIAEACDLQFSNSDFHQS